VRCRRSRWRSSGPAGHPGRKPGTYLADRPAVNVGTVSALAPLGQGAASADGGGTRRSRRSSLRPAARLSEELCVRPGRHVGVSLGIGAQIYRVRAKLNLEGVRSPSLTLHRSALLAKPARSDGAHATQRCQGCSRPRPELQAQTAPSFLRPLRRPTGEVSHPADPTAPRGARPQPPSAHARRPARHPR
jgi:hypothetical protein